MGGEPSGQLRLGFETASGPKESESAVLEAPLDGPGPFEDALWAEDEGRFTDAVEAYRAALDAGDSRPEVTFNLGNVLFAMGCHADAAAAFLVTVESEPEFVEAWNNLGNTLDELDRRRESVLAFSKALAIAPDYADAHYNLADTLAALGDAVGATRHWRRYLEVDPTGPCADEVRVRMAELACG